MRETGCADCGATANVRAGVCGDCRSDRAWRQYYATRALADCMRRFVAAHAGNDEGAMTAALHHAIHIVQEAAG